MSVKTFIDTNVLIYAHDADSGEKHRIARELLRELWLDRTGVLSPQVLQEFYVNVTRKIPRPLTKPIARGIIDNYSVWCIDTTAVEIANAFRIEDASKKILLGRSHLRLGRKGRGPPLVLRGPEPRPIHRWDSD